MHTRVPPRFCLRCGVLNDAASDARKGGASPKPGDLSVCLYCGHVTTFADDLTLRELTDEEKREIESNEEIQVVLRARAMARREIEEE